MISTSEFPAIKREKVDKPEMPSAFCSSTNSRKTAVAQKSKIRYPPCRSLYTIGFKSVDEAENFYKEFASFENAVEGNDKSDPKLKKMIFVQNRRRHATRS